MANLPDCPQSLKSIQHYLKAAQEHDSRDAVISYWCRFYAVQMGLKITTHSAEETKLFIGIMEWLEVQKKELSDNDAIHNETVAQAHIENYAYKLFSFADAQDRAANFGKNVVKSFYTAGLMFDVLETFGDHQLSEENSQKRKYCKWKAAYIHNCLKNGETPIPGPMQGEDDELEPTNDDTNEPSQSTPPEDAPPANFGFQDPNEFSNFDNSASTSSLSDVVKKLPTPPAEPEKPPGGFKPFVPDAAPYYQPPPVEPVGNVNLTPEQITKAQKYCKWATSALTYDDVQTAIDNLQKGLRLLTTGQDG